MDLLHIENKLAKLFGMKSRKNTATWKQKDRRGRNEAKSKDHSQPGKNPARSHKA